MTAKIQRFNSQDVKIVTKEPLYDGFFNMVRYGFQHKKYDGSWTNTISREVFERGHAVAVLPYDPDTQEFVLIEQVRIGAVPTSDSPWLIEIIAGIIDEGESEQDVCCREAQEEAGIELSNVTKALSYLASPGGTTERLHVYVARTDATRASGVHGLAEESEDILVLRVAEDTVREWLATGKIDNAASIIALQWFFMNKQSLLQQWQHGDQ